MLPFDLPCASDRSSPPHPLSLPPHPFIPVPCAPRLIALRLWAEAAAEAGTSAATFLTAYTPCYLLTFADLYPCTPTASLHTPFIPVPCAPRLTTLRLRTEAAAEAGTSAAGLGQAPASVNKRRGFSRAPNPGAAEAQAGGTQRVGACVGSHSDGSQPAG